MIQMILWCGWFVAGVWLVLILSVKLLPKIFFLVFSASYQIKDRGIGIFNRNDGVAIMYEPSHKARPFINCYLLFKNDSTHCCFFVGEWTRIFSYVNYSIVAYDCRGMILEVYRISEKPNGRRFTCEKMLPERTDYVSVILHRADDKKIFCERKVNFTLTFASIFLFSVIFTGFLVLLTWISYCFLSYCIEYFSLSFSLPELFLVLINSAICVFILSLVALTLYVLSGRTQNTSSHRRQKRALLHLSIREIAGKTFRPIFTKLRNLINYVCYYIFKILYGIRNFICELVWLKPVVAVRHIKGRMIAAFSRFFRKKTLHGKAQ